MSGTDEQYRKIIKDKGWDVQMPDNLCPSLAFFLLKGIADFMFVSLFDHQEGEGECGGKINGEYGCGANFSYVFDTEKKIVLVTGSPCQGEVLSS